MTSAQCHGTTKKGTRCLIRVTNGDWCHYHIPKAPQRRSEKPLSPVRTPSPDKTRPSSKPMADSKLRLQSTFVPMSPEVAKKGGYIYVYTLSAFFDKQKAYIQTRNLLSKDRKDEWVNVDTRKTPTILVKVGMTTKTPAIRIQQWEAKCNHSLKHIYPESASKKSGFLQKFKRLTMDPVGSYHTYDNQLRGFRAAKNILDCETQIHANLRKRYGRGSVQCTGCLESTPETSRSLGFRDFFGKNLTQAETNYNIHNEWFPVPRKNLHEVFTVIESVCQRYT